jgi:catechol 2,3-dioxygenase-like lactoylglutathione lyase family enzyme
MRIHHVALRTRDIGRLSAFYCEVLAFAISDRHAARSVWLRAGDAIVMIEQADSAEPEPAPGSMDMIAFCIDPRDRANFEARFAAAGVVVEARTAYTLYVRDPDGRRVGLSHYPNT